MAISRIHFRLLYADGFCPLEKYEYPGQSEFKRLIPRQWFEFFKVFSDKHLLNNPEAIYLPKELRMMIIGYLRQERNFYVQDMGSVHGTFILLRHGKPRSLHRGQTFQVGSSEIYLNMIDARLPRKLSE